MQETRLYDPEKDETRSMRIKEEAHDYRYFPDPDLLPLEISEQWINEIRAALPESQQAKRKEFMSLGLSAYQATLLTTSREMAEYATNTVSGVPTEVIPSLANIIVGPLSARLNKENLPLTEIPISPDQLKQLGERIHDGTVSASAAVTVLAIMWPGGGDADTIIKKHGLKQISDAGAIEKIVDEVLAANSKQVEDYHAGKEKAFNSLVGQVMKATKGKANPQQLNEILKRKLAG
jgi:aspartyl-tRNA(Asn)/glutamyl-tRNA(Gln) amidotransferase subunit B